MIIILTTLLLQKIIGANRVLQAVKNIIQNVQKSKNQLPLKNIKVMEKWEWKEENDGYVSKIYHINDSEREIAKITLDKGIEEGIKIVDENNIEKDVFETNENFKIRIPIDKIKDKMSFKINYETSFKNQPILYGKTAYSGWKGINLQFLTYENGKGEYEDTYDKSTTEIKNVENAKVENKKEENKKLPLTGI